MIAEQPTAADFEMKYDAEHTFPFFEDENANWIVGHGHQDRAEFAKLVNDFDTLATGEAWPYTEGDVQWIYGFVSGSDDDFFVHLRHEDFSAIESTEAGAFPVTVISR